MHAVYTYERGTLSKRVLMNDRNWIPHVPSTNNK